jgi:hypothetical protein
LRIVAKLASNSGLAVPIPHIDARTIEAAETRTALVRFDDAAVMFTASWGEPSIEVPRPDGSRRRQYRVRLIVPAEHVTRPFHLSRSIALYAGTDEPLVSEDFGGVHAPHSDGLTLAWFVTDESRFAIGGLGAEPSRKAPSLLPSLTIPAKPSKS